MVITQLCWDAAFASIYDHFLHFLVLYIEQRSDETIFEYLESLLNFVIVVFVAFWVLPLHITLFFLSVTYTAETKPTTHYFLNKIKYFSYNT